VTTHLIPAHFARPDDDPIFALNREASERHAQGEAIVNATVGTLLDDEGKLAVLPTAARVVHEVAAEDWANYAPIAGSPDFLRAVILDLLRSEPRLHECAVAVATPGGTGALRNAIGNFLEPGQSLLTTSFYWGPYGTLADDSERKLKTFPMFSGETLDIAAFDRALGEQLRAEKRALIFLNDPCHNPTGYSMRPSEWRATVEALLAHAGEGPITLLVDCAYLAYGAGDPRAFLKELVPLVGRVAVLFAWSGSKAFTHYGLRVGALVVCIADEAERRAARAAMVYSCRGAWSNCNRGGLAAITRMLVEPDLVRACDAERAKLKAMLEARVRSFNALARARGLAYPRYDGGFFVTVFADKAQERAAAMKAKGVFVVPQTGALRAALCSVAERDVPRLVDALATA
jgi:aromatic-amino-acid transaminase